MDERRAAARAEALVLEQTVEVPRAVVRAPAVLREALGRVEALSPDAAGGQLVEVAYPVATTSFEPAQLLNVVFGNSSLHADVQCVDVDLPASLFSALGGPRFGSAGLRKVVGAAHRPLTCTAIKPMGLGTPALADLCETFARAGIDVIKDDHGLADQRFSPFEERVAACLSVVERVADETGHRAVYAPNLIGSPERVARAADFAQARGARAVMASPMLIGLPAFWELCRQRVEVPVLAHPSFGGALRIAPEALFGKIFRLLGADAVIYVSFGSRFGPGEDTCRRLADNLRRSWGGLLPSLPVPGGGIAIESAEKVVAFYGSQVMLLVGGDLQLDAGALLERSRLFVEAVRAAGAAIGP